MTVKESGAGLRTRGGRLGIFSPLLGWAAFVVYQIFFDRSPFLVKWIEGSFALFLALVVCNILRTRAQEDPGAPGVPGSEPPPPPQEGH